jgi:RNA polymerase sigma factor FliA
MPRTAQPRVSGTSESRDAFLTQHLGLVHHVARQMANRLSTQADLDELISAGSLGLLQAVDAFDRLRGLSFSTFAVPRIRGAILDELRKQDHVPRNVRRRTRDLSRARDSLTEVLRRQPSEFEMSRVLQVPAEMVRRWELDAEGASVASLDQTTHAAHSGVTLGDTITEDRVATVEDLLTHEQEVGRLRLAIGMLKPQERTVLALNFFEELKLQEIASVMGLSVCRISQIRTAALHKLRNALSYLRAA